MSTVSTITSIIGIKKQRDVSKEQRKQNSIRNRIAATKRVRDIRKAVATARVRRAEVESAGFQFGVAGGTAVQGATAGVTGDLASVIGASNIQFTGQQVLAESANRISELQQSIATLGAVSQLASELASAATSAVGGG